ncbi:hypothetical protein EN836_32050 [Mesorhizobium sp. M1C.F.Ca.ET.193.01.1.1]|nr:hypothetical protein EJ074_18430 [Mesorhizobium sp. M3A.F.Ca.ET.080.04.2.1]RWA59284.1 MAG: hypothetical protein EOQ29_34090 [Mesorhizobium sp.]TGQ49792.1 hypothetical protein EN853_32045 [Mesorhizobium sp. M1C.F.Ca.ET.210.01.1.1]TGQ62696.1 hypothetical protein EN848_32280 [bacterium M00.F.Ca.ET.205.01.1.1]TGQ64260.1 hypothetical protein EN855_032060 [Mesorhizobium sp. M1C.F.Ca.ET.212.01.1.1]TGQ97710.1 hypothetical protein EN847_32410 [Mesorhizobium sp. M1C.F.Ca.ET.204.01.1.1]TGR17996.1 hyp
MAPRRSPAGHQGALRRRVLKRLGFSHMSARPRHPAQDADTVEGCKKNSRAH